MLRLLYLALMTRSVFTFENVTYSEQVEISASDSGARVKFFDTSTFFGNIENYPSSTNDPRETVESFELLHQLPFVKHSERIENYPTDSARTGPVRRFLNHYNSLRPVALLVDDTQDSCTAARNFMRDVFQLTNTARHITFFISKFNVSGVTSLIEISGHDARTIDEVLVYKPKVETSYLGLNRSNGTVAFFAILNAAAALPQGGAIIVFLDRKPADEDLASHTGIVRKNNIKVYVVWGGPYPSQSSEENLLEELCRYSEGLFLTNGKKHLSNYNYRIFLENESSFLNTSVILSKINIVGESHFDLPIDTEVTGIHLITTPTHSGTLTSPTGQKLDLRKNDDVADYGSGSFAIVESGRREIYLETTRASASVGIWHLIHDNALAPYNVTVFVHTKLTAHAFLVNRKTGNEDATTTRKTQVLHLNFTGYVGSVNNITFVDKNGEYLGESVKFNEKRDFLTLDDDSMNNNKFNLEVENIPQQSFQVLILGQDIQGNTFSRLTYVSKYSHSNIFPQPILGIDVGSGSGLIITGGNSAAITLEVTNFKSTSIAVRFFCKDERSILSTMTPYNQVISPQETSTVRITLAPRYGSYQDIITFSAMVESEVIEKKIQVDVGNSPIIDQTEPTLDYKYLSDCSKVQFSSCEDGTWTIEVKAKDTESGLLQVISNPKGLYFPVGFTTGTKEEVTGYYSDSCCNPEFQLAAVDRLNNRKTINPNAYRASLGPGQIAAIVLGVLLFILLIVLIVYLIRRCLKKREEYNLPTYRGRKI